MNSSLLLLVESNTTGTGRQFAQRARRLGVEPVLISADPARYPYAAEDGLRTVITRTADPSALLAAARHLAGKAAVAGVLSSSEYYVAAAAALAAELGLPAADAAAIRACRDKAIQRLTLAEAGVPVPGFREVADVDSAASAAAALGLPVVVKPVQGSGSLGVKLCRTEAEVVEHAETLLAATVNERGLSTPAAILVEQFLTGREFSVEVFGDRPVAVVAKHVSDPPVFVETGHDLPAVLLGAARHMLTDCAVAAVKSLGLGWGAAHVELRLDNDGIARVVEVNPRLAGGMIPELVRRALGIDLIEAQVRTALGLGDQIEAVTDEDAAIGAASIRFLTVQREAVLGDPADAVAAAAAIAGVVDVGLYRRAGDAVAPAVDFRGRFGHVIAAAADLAQAAAAAERAQVTLLSIAGTEAAP